MNENDFRGLLVIFCLPLSFVVLVSAWRRLEPPTSIAGRNLELHLLHSGMEDSHRALGCKPPAENEDGYLDCEAIKLDDKTIIHIECGYNRRWGSGPDRCKEKS